MNSQSVVSIHPYFQPHEGKTDAFKALLPRFIEKTRSEKGCLWYDFTECGDILFCREAYIGGEGALAHLENVDDLLKEVLGLAELVRLEIHGSAEELDKLRGPLDGLPVEWFVLECGLEKKIEQG